MTETQTPVNTSTLKQVSWLTDLKQGQNCWMLLDDFAFIIVEGPDAQKFLQGQCTCDLTGNTTREFLPGAHCNPQGRMLSSFVLIKMASEKFALRLHRSIVESAFNDLKKYIVFSKASIQPGSEFTALGLYSPAPAQVLSMLGVNELEVGEFSIHEGGWVLRLSKDQYEFWFKTGYLREHSTLFNTETFCPAHQWDLLNIRRGVAEVREQTRAEYLPQEMNLQLLNGVSFKKGCYTGQEVIARIHYKGKLRKHMYRALVDSPDFIPPGTVLRQQEKAIGSVILTAPVSESVYELLALSQDTAINAENVQPNAASSSFLRWLPLPYAIPG